MFKNISKNLKCILFKKNYIYTGSNQINYASNSPIKAGAATITHFPKYSIDESNQILNLINNSDSEYLYNFNISKHRVQKIQSWKTKYGIFSSVEQLLDIDGFGVKVLEKFYVSILTGKANKLKTQKISSTIKPLNFIYPNLCNKHLLKVENLVSIYIGTTTISWTHFNISKLSDRPTKINNWQCYDFENKKFHLNDLVNLILHLNTLIPIGDLYILENPTVIQNIGGGGQTGNSIQINVNIQKSQILAMLSFLFANRKYNLSNIDNSNNINNNNGNKNINKDNNNINNNNDNNNNNNNNYDSNIKRKIELNSHKERVQHIYFMKSYIVSRLFNTLVGSERISSEFVIESVLRYHYNLKDVDDKNEIDKKKMSTEIYANSMLKENYENAENYQKEYMGRSLLLGLAFLRLCIFKCDQSYESLKNKR